MVLRKPFEDEEFLKFFRLTNLFKLAFSQYNSNLKGENELFWFRQATIRNRIGVIMHM